MKRALLFMALASVAFGLDVKTYRELAHTPSEQADLDAHLEGFASGLTYANGALVLLGRKPLFCQPPSFGLNVGNLRDLLDTKIEKLSKAVPEAKLNGMDAQAMLLMALIESFPCEKK